MTAPAKRRRSIRLSTYDYAAAGAYFVTICAEGRRPLFEDRTLAGMIEKEWRLLPTRFPSIVLDAFVIMPNHIHFILWLNLTTNTVGAPLAGALDAPAHRSISKMDESRFAVESPGAGASPAPTLGTVVGAFKSRVATSRLR